MKVKMKALLAVLLSMGFALADEDLSFGEKLDKEKCKGILSIGSAIQYNYSPDPGAGEVAGKSHVVSKLSKGGVDYLLCYRGGRRYQLFVIRDGGRPRLLNAFETRETTLRLVDLNFTSSGDIIALFLTEFGFDVMKAKDELLIMYATIALPQGLLTGRPPEDGSDVRVVVAARLDESGALVLDYKNSPIDRFTFPQGSDSVYLNDKPNWGTIKWFKNN